MAYEMVKPTYLLTSGYSVLKWHAATMVVVKCITNFFHDVESKNLLILCVRFSSMM